jgi:hypothetical protein
MTLSSFRLTRGSLALLLVGVAGGLFAWWMAALADREMRASLLKQTRLVAQALNLAEIKALAGSEADLGRPEYGRLKEQLIAVRMADPKCRFLYLMGRKSDGAVFFYVDSEPAGAKDYSPPGQIYTEIPDEYQRVFATATTAVEGPVADRWGVWVSALVPLTEPSTGALVAVLAMDVDARTWKWDVTARAALPVGLMLLVLACGAALMVTTGRFTVFSPASWSAGRHWPLPWIVLAASLACCGAGTLFMKSNVQSGVEKEFNSRCDRICSLIADRLDDHAWVLWSGAAFFQASGRVTREEWRTFVARQGNEKPLAGIQGTGFSLLIPRTELPRHLQEVRGEGFPDYTVKPEGDREIYTSILYLEPFADRNLRAFGFDMFSDPVRRSAMERARDTNSAALSGKVVLMQETSEDAQPGALIYVPVYRPGMPLDSIEQRRTAIMAGFMAPTG